MESDKISVAALIAQYLSAMSIAYLTTLTGFVYAWPSYTIANFISNDTVLSAPMSSMEISLLGSLTNVGALIVTPFCGYAVNTFGRKYAVMLFGVPYVISWAIISITNYVPLVLAAIGIAGVGAAGQAASTVYISEISHDSIRGCLTSFTVSGYFLGLLFSYILGGYLTYHQVVYTHLTLSVLYILMLMLIKESPVYLLQNGRDEEAAQAIAFYRHVEVTSKEVEIEIRKIKLQLDPRIDEILHGENDPEVRKDLIDKKPGAAVEAKTESEWKFLMKSESSKRAMFTVLTLMALSISMGSIVLQVYAEPLFKEATPTMPPNLCAVLVAIDFLVASLGCAVLIDKFGRRSLMTVTSIASGVCTLLLGTQLQLHWAPHWCTAVAIYTYCFVYTLGAAIVPFVLTAEVFLPEVRGLGNSLSMACMWIMNFITLMIFNLLVECIGLGSVFYCFSVICFLGATYSHICLPETKGLPADAIQLLFLKKKHRNNKE